MDQLDGHVEKAAQQCEARSRKPCAGIRPQFARVLHGEQHRAGDGDRPDRQAGLREEQALQRREAIEQRGRIPQGDPPGQQAPAILRWRQLFEMRHQDVEIGWLVGLDEAGFAQSRQQVDQLLLRRGIAIAGQHRVPKLRDRLLAVHPRDDPIGGRVEANLRPTDAIRKNVPALAAQALTLQTQVRHEARPDPGDAIPACTVDSRHDQDLSTPKGCPRRFAAGCGARLGRGRVLSAHNEAATPPRGPLQTGPSGDLTKGPPSALQMLAIAAAIASICASMASLW